jgi:hypothetical protein
MSGAQNSRVEVRMVEFQTMKVAVMAATIVLNALNFCMLTYSTYLKHKRAAAESAITAEEAISKKNE